MSETPNETVNDLNGYPVKAERKPCAHCGRLDHDGLDARGHCFDCEFLLEPFDFSDDERYD